MEVRKTQGKSFLGRIFSSENASTDDFANRKVPSNWSYGYWGIMLPLTGGGTAGFWLAFGPSLSATYGTANMIAAIIYGVIAQLILAYVLVSISSRTRLSSDLASRGLGFGYMGSVITAVVYGITFLYYFALESQILGSGLASYFHFPEKLGWFLVGIVLFIPLTIYGMVFVTKFQNWTLPLFAFWIIYNVIVIFQTPGAASKSADFLTYMPPGQHFGGIGLFKSIAAVNGLITLIPILSMEFARFAKTDISPQRRFWGNLGVASIPQNIFTWLLLVPMGALVWMVTGSLNPGDAFIQLTGLVGLLGLFITQIRINLEVTYGGSMALSTIFSRVFHFKPGRAFWSVVTCVIGTMLIFVNMLKYINEVVTVDGVLLFVWIGVLVADYIIVRKWMKLPVGEIEHRRAYLRKVNPIGVLSFVTGAIIGLVLNYGPAIGYMPGSGGEEVASLAAFIAFLVTIIVHPIYASAFLKLQRHPYLVRLPEKVPQSAIVDSNMVQCSSCGVKVDVEDVARCPVAQLAWICSECCSTHSGCGSKCHDHETVFTLQNSSQTMY